VRRCLLGSRRRVRYTSPLTVRTPASPVSGGKRLKLLRTDQLAAGVGSGLRESGAMWRQLRGAVSKEPDRAYGNWS